MRKVLFATIFGFLACSSTVFAWTAPTAAPPGGNIDTPITTGSATQTKTGALGPLFLNPLTVAPSPVTNKLYNVGGTLYFNGSAIGGGGTVSSGGSGSSNYVSKFTGTATLGNSQIYDNGSYVGIGTTGGSGKFQVYGLGGPASWTGYFTGANNGLYAEAASAGGWGGQFVGGYGVYGQGSVTNGYGVQGYNPNGYGGYFTGTYGLYSGNSAGYYAHLSNSSWGLLTNGNVYTSDVYLTSTGTWLSSSANSNGAGYWTGWFTTGCGTAPVVACSAGYAVTQTQYSLYTNGSCNGAPFMQIQSYCQPN